MKCEKFEGYVSDYIEGELSRERARDMDRHMLVCAACSETLVGVLQVRSALHGLSTLNSPAIFRLKLAGFLQGNAGSVRRIWSRSLAVGLAVAAALAVLLWPEDQLDEGAERFALEGPATLESPAFRRVWLERFPELSRPGPHSHAHVRTVSF